MKHIQQRFNDMYKVALLANWRVWPLAQVCVSCDLASRKIDGHLFAADQLQIHAATVSCPLPGHLWSVLDIVPVAFECQVRMVRLGTMMLLTGSQGNQRHKTRKTA